MDTIKRHIGGKTRYYKVYSKAEADEAGIEYVHWREAKVGGWALTDDGYVGECIKIYGPYTQKGYKRRNMAFSFARAWDNKGYQLNYQDRKKFRAWSSMSTEHWAERKVNTRAAKRLILAYVLMFMTGKIDWRKLGIIYQPNNDPRYYAKRVKLLIKQEAFQRMIQEKMVDIFKRRDKSEEDILDMVDKSFAMAEKKENAKDMRKGAETYIRLFDMNPVVQPTLPAWDNAEDAELEDIDEIAAKLPQLINEHKKDSSAT